MFGNKWFVKMAFVFVATGLIAACSNEQEAPDLGTMPLSVTSLVINSPTAPTNVGVAPTNVNVDFTWSESHVCGNDRAIITIGDPSSPLAQETFTYRPGIEIRNLDCFVTGVTHYHTFIHTIDIPAGSSPGAYDLTVYVDEKWGGSWCCGRRLSYAGVVVVSPPNQLPTASASDVSGDEGSSIALSGSGSDDDGDPLTYTWSYSASPSGTGTCVITDTDSSDAMASILCDDNGTYTVTLTVDDGTEQATATAEVVVNNVVPSVTPITVSSELVAVSTVVTANSSFTDPGTADTHGAVWNWGDGTTNNQTLAMSPVSDSHTYSAPGVYTLSLDVTDDDGGTSSALYQYIVVYDPSGGFVTGGGWIDSPAGAYVDDPTLTGKANFGFVSKYKKGASVPTGSTEFQFKAGSFNFHSNVQEWLVVNQGGSNAQFKGVGTVNGSNDANGNPYGFMIWAGDSPDTFRIRVWTENGGVETDIYDNGAGQLIGGGSIVIHTRKGKN